MKVILNQDVQNLGEMGDTKEVAAGYACNCLFPRGLALPLNTKTLSFFERRKQEIESHKEEKRQSSASLREKIEAQDVSFTMPAGANGKLFGAVTNQTIADELLRRNITVDRKKIEIPDKALKSVGNYKVIIHLYEKEQATLKVGVLAQEVKKAEPAPESSHRSHRRAAEAKAEEEAGAAEVPAAEAAPQAEEKTE
jgi:large subunit ribosomal protein L9